MMKGIGTPRNNSNIERIFYSSYGQSRSSDDDYVVALRAPDRCSKARTERAN
jgi:hypothetical protein